MRSLTLCRLCCFCLCPPGGSSEATWNQRLTSHGPVWAIRPGRVQVAAGERHAQHSDTAGTSHKARTIIFSMSLLPIGRVQLWQGWCFKSTQD
jgi:hypothetical protein